MKWNEMKYILLNKIYNNFRQYLKTEPKEISNIYDKKNIKKAKL